jgi:uracil-DNA glycosylase family 4
MTITDLIKLQEDFQLAVGFPIDSQLESERNRLSEIFLFKAIEEIIELRKEFPSAMNPWAKTQKFADTSLVLKEYCDVLLFLINFANLWKFSPEQILESLKSVQHANFQKIKEKKLAQLNHEILRVPGHVSGVGSGALFPKYIFVGQNPGRTITHGYEFWSNKEDGSSKILLPILDELNVRDKCYFTNLVKCVTPNNSEPDIALIQFWGEFLDREIAILRCGNFEAKIIPMGRIAQRFLLAPGISHPASVMRGNLTRDDYKREITTALAT